MEVNCEEVAWNEGAAARTVDSFSSEDSVEVWMAG